MDEEAAPPPTVTIKAKIEVVKEIREALTPTQVKIFEETCKRIRFRRQEFCLVTGLRFGSNMYMKKWVKNLTDNPFRNRIFPHIKANVSVKLSDIIDIFDKMRKRTLVLEDNDAIWILEAIPATHRYVHKQTTEKIPRALAWESTQPFTWLRCCTLFVGDQLAPPLETLTPTKAESETDWWKASLEYFEGKHVQSEVVSEQLDIEKDGISEKKRKRSSSESSLQDPTYDQLMTTVTKLEGTVATLTETVSTLHGTIGTLESRLLTLEGDARVSTLTQTVSSLQGTINTLESRLLALEGDERDFGVVSDGDIAAYMSPGPSYTSPASTAQKSLPLANRRKLRVRRTPLKLKSPMRCYSRKMRCTIPPPASTTMPPVATISVPMTTTKVLKDTKDAAKDVAKDAAKDTHLDAVTTISVPMTTTEKFKDTIHIDASDAAAQETFCTEDELQFIGMEKGDKPNYVLPDLSMICDPSFWDVLYPGGEKAEYLEEGNLDGLWTLGLSELVAFHIDSGMRLSMVSVVDALRATIDGTNPRFSPP
ncbi:hypothetical protein Tco_0578701 [Tanacetum coccineum]